MVVSSEEGSTTIPTPVYFFGQAFTMATTSSREDGRSVVAAAPPATRAAETVAAAASRGRTQRPGAESAFMSVSLRVSRREAGSRPGPPPCDPAGARWPVHRRGLDSWPWRRPGLRHDRSGASAGSRRGVSGRAGRRSAAEVLVGGHGADGVDDPAGAAVLGAHRGGGRGGEPGGEADAQQAQDQD